MTEYWRCGVMGFFMKQSPGRPNGCYIEVILALSESRTGFRKSQPDFILDNIENYEILGGRFGIRINW